MSIADKLATWITHISHPRNTGIALLLTVGWTSTRSLKGVLWGGTAAVMVSGPVSLYIAWQVGRSRIGSHRITVREQRVVPLMLGIAWILPTVRTLRRFNAPADVTELVGAMSLGLCTFTLITLHWKVSFHTGVASGCVATVRLLYGNRRALWLLPAIPLVGWSRVRLTEHTVGQVVGGAVLGMLVTQLWSACYRSLNP